MNRSFGQGRIYSELANDKEHRHLYGVMGSMIHLKSIIITISLIVIVIYFPVTGSSFTISYDRVRN